MCVAGQEHPVQFVFAYKGGGVQHVIGAEEEGGEAKPKALPTVRAPSACTPYYLVLYMQDSLLVLILQCFIRLV